MTMWRRLIGLIAPGVREAQDIRQDALEWRTENPEAHATHMRSKAIRARSRATRYERRGWKRLAKKTLAKAKGFDDEAGRYERKAAKQ